jgi:hypothetical protein
MRRFQHRLLCYACLVAIGASCGSTADTNEGNPGLPPEQEAGAGDGTSSSFDSSSPSNDAPTTGTADGAGDVAEGVASDAQADDGTATAPEAEAPPDGGPCALETIRVPGTGSAAAFTTSLDKDATYLLKAVGSVTAAGQMVDAEFAFAPAGTATDVVEGVDVGIDVGLLWPNRPMRFTQVPPGPSRMKWNPVAAIDANNNVAPGAAFRADSTYYMIAIGSGRPLSLKLVLPGMTRGAGSIAVSLYALSPPPPAMYGAMHATMPMPPPPPKTCGGALDAVDISVAAPTVVTSTYKTDATKLYLLQASGTAPVGAAGLGDGDAEYMDFGGDVRFNGFNDGESCADFGIGVDELMVSHCHVNPMCVHRKNWWGTVGVDTNTTMMYNSPTYRNDHIYYMVYAGTGKPISFVYFDSGYGDNQHFDVMVRIFPMP